jgi:hypothetical protein
VSYSFPSIYFSKEIYFIFCKYQGNLFIYNKISHIVYWTSDEEEKEKGEEKFSLFYDFSFSPSSYLLFTAAAAFICHDTKVHSEKFFSFQLLQRN